MSRPQIRGLNEAPDRTEGKTSPFMSVKEVAEYLHLNTKKVYALVSEGQIPATKVTGKWLFPRKLVDQWLMESSHGGLLTDRLVITGSDDPIVQRVVTRLVQELAGHAVVGYTVAGTQLGLGLLARHRVDVCAVRWGPARESQHRHAALLQQHPPHKAWVLVRAFTQERGLMLGSNFDYMGDLSMLFRSGVRWAMRPDNTGTERHLEELCVQYNFDPSRLRVVHTVQSERESASLLARQQADVAPGSRAIAGEFGLDFAPLDWEAYDLALDRGVYFRTLFQRFIETLKSEDSRMYAQSLGGYDFRQCGQIIWSD
jgi:putative molybdopterin biosynthesis protein